MSLKNNISNRIHPQLFGLWLALASITMMFGALTSAYIVRQAAGNWLEFRLPDLFIVSTIVILLSSISLQFSYNAYKSQKELIYKSGLLLSLILGVTFLVLQYNAWMQLFNMGVDMKINPSGSFLYVITGVHAAHIIGGVTAMIVACLHAFTLPFFFSKQRKVRFQMVLHYWHFVDVLWVYLFIFLLMTR